METDLKNQEIAALRREINHWKSSHEAGLEMLQKSTQGIELLKQTQKWLTKIMADHDHDEKGMVYLGAKRQHDKNAKFLSS